MNITINNQTIETEAGITILEAAKKTGIYIPTLCFLKGINEISACRVCMVQVNGSPRLVPACSTKIAEGMVIETDNAYIRASRRSTLELLASNHRMECTECPRGADCKLRDLCKEYEVDDKVYGVGKREKYIDESTAYLVRDNSKCILCRRCVSFCTNVQGIGAIAANYKGANTNIGFPPGLKLSDTKCVACGQCVAVCPTGALSVKDDTKEVWKALYDKKKYVIIGITPATAYSIGNFFGEKTFTNNGGKVAAILRRIGFDRVIDAGTWDKEYEDMIREKIIHRVKSGNIPVLSSDDQAWVNYINLYRPELKKYLLDAPSKSEFIAEQVREQLPDYQVFYVHIDATLSTKTAKKKWVGVHLTVRELFMMIRRACVSNFTAEQVWKWMQHEPFDIPAGKSESRSPGALSPFKEEVIQAGDIQLKIARASGLKHAAECLQKMNDYDYIEVNASYGEGLYAGGEP